MENEKKYPIKAVSQLTGLSVHVIRAWEKRYNAVEPVRTDTNRRLYKESDIEKLNMLVKLTNNGHNIGGIAGLSLDSLKELFSGFSQTSVKKNDEILFNNSDPHLHINRCLESIYAFDAKELESGLMSAAIALSQPILFEQVILPLTFMIGEKWKSGEIRIYQEHMFSSVVKSYLLSLVEASNVSDTSPTILVTTPQNQIHEIGALIAAVYASSEGWNVSYLGPDLPAEEIIAAAIRINSKVIALSIVYPDDQMALRRDLKKLGEVLPKNMKLIIGGNGAQYFKDVLNEINANIVADFEEYRNLLTSFRNQQYN